MIDAKEACLSGHRYTDIQRPSYTDAKELCLSGHPCRAIESSQEPFGRVGFLVRLGPAQHPDNDDHDDADEDDACDGDCA